jgi:hypothetical protein
VSGIAAKLAMVRDMRSMAAQSRPLAVSALPQPMAPATESGSQGQPPAVPVVAAPASLVPTVEAAPAPSIEPVLQEPADDEERAAIEDPETETAAVVPAPAPAVAAADASKPSNRRAINKVETAAKAPSQNPARTVLPPPSVTASAKIFIVREEAGKPAAIQASPRVLVSTQSVSTQPRTPAPAPKPSATAKPPAPVVAAVPKAAEPGSNPSTHSAVMTRRADVTNAVATRTAGAPLVLAPPRDSWESMVRVSLPQQSAALPTPANRKIAIEPPAEPAGWSAVLTRWVSSAVGFVTSIFG